MANLESPICEESAISADKILLRSEPGKESSLSAWNITQVSMANNHVFDHGEQGFRATLAALEAWGIGFSGAGENLVQASKPLIIHSESCRVGILACTDGITQAQLATEGGPGCNPLVFPQVQEQIRQLSSQVDFTIVCPHWGYCDFAYPSQEVVAQGEALLAAGANMVVGHHSHIVQGISKRKEGGIIAYSLGDFCFDVYQFGKRVVLPSEENRRGMVLIVDIDENHIPKVEQVYTKYRDSLIEINTSKQRESEMVRRSAPLQDGEQYASFWKGVVRKRFLARLMYWVNPLHWGSISIATLVSAFTMLRQLVVREGKGPNDRNCSDERQTRKGQD